MTPDPHPLIPGSPAARLLHRIWLNSPIPLETLDEQDRTALPLALRSLVFRADAAVRLQVRVSSLDITAPELVKRVLSDALHAELTAASLVQEYTAGYGIRTCEITSGRSRTIYLQATARIEIIASLDLCTIEARGLSHDLPLDVILAGQSA